MAEERLKAWLRQARADWRAGQAQDISPCHRRYFLQQACEKGIKSLGIILWGQREHDEGLLRHYFLSRHSPLKHLATEVQNDDAVPRSLRFLLRQIETELATLDGSSVLQRVDATTPTMNPADPSYRYPFVDGSGKDVAPVDWTETDWDAYQGNAPGIVAAAGRFLSALENRRIAGRV